MIVPFPSTDAKHKTVQKKFQALWFVDAEISFRAQRMTDSIFEFTSRPPRGQPSFELSSPIRPARRSGQGPGVSASLRYLIDCSEVRRNIAQEFLNAARSNGLLEIGREMRGVARQ